MSSRATALVDDGQGSSYCGRLSAIHALMAISEPAGFIGAPLPDTNWTERNVQSNDTESGIKSASITDTVPKELNVTATDVSEVDAEKYQGTINTGNTSRRPITDPYFLYKSMDILMGLNNPIIRVCRFDGCEDEVFQIPSDDKFQLDIGETNQKTYSPTGYCRKHLMGSKKCEFSGCDKCSQGSTKFCIKHGGGRRCTIEGCDKGARDKQFCAGHGGGKRCSVASCNKSAVGGSGHCCVHGGGKKCTFEGCFKSAQSPTQFCVKHGGGKTCITEGCIKVSRGTTSHCAGHGGGTRCSFRDCNKAAMSSNDVCRIHSGFSNTISKPKKVKYVKSQSLSNSSEKKNSATCGNNEYDAIHDNSYFVNPLPSDDLYLGPDDHELFYDDEYPNSDDSKGATIIENHRINTGSKSQQHIPYYSHNSVTADSTCTQSSNGRSLTAEVCVPCLPQVKGALSSHPSKHSSVQLHASPRNDVSCGSYIERLPRSESDAFESMFRNYRNGAGNYEGNSIVSGAASVYGSPSRMGQESGSADRSGDEEVHHGLHQSSSLNDVLQALDRIGKPQYFDSCRGLELRRASVPLAVTYNPYQHMGSTIFNNAAHNYHEREGLSHGRQQLHSPSSNSFPYTSLIPMPLPSLLPASSLLASISDNSCFKIFRKADNEIEKGPLRQPEQASSSSSSSRRGSDGDSCSIEGSESQMKGSSSSDIYADRSFHDNQSRYKTLDGTPSIPTLMRTSSSLNCPTALNTRGFSGDQSPLLRGTQTSSLLSAATSPAFERSGVIDGVPRFYARRNSFDGCSSSEVEVFGNRSAANSSSKSDSNSNSHSNSSNSSGSSREDMGCTGLGLSLPLPLPPAASGGERPKIFERHQAVSPSRVLQKQALPPPNTLPLPLSLPLSLSPPPMRHLHKPTSNKSPQSIAGHLEPQVGSADHSATNWTSRGGSEDSDADADGSVRRDSIDMMDSSFAADILLAYAAQTHEPYIDTSGELNRSSSQPSLELFHRDSSGQEDVKSKESYDTIQTIISTSEEHGTGLYAQNGVRDQFFLPSRQSSTASAQNTRKRVRGDRDGVVDEAGV